MGISSNKSLSRRKFVSAVGVLGVAGLCSVPLTTLAKPTPPDETPILKTGPYLQAPYPSKITVRFITHVPCYGWVEFGEEANKLDKKANTVCGGLVEANNTVHAITLNDLTPGKNYF